MNKLSIFLILIISLFIFAGCQNGPEKPVIEDTGEWINLGTAGQTEIRDLEYIKKTNSLLASCIPEITGSGLQVFNLTTGIWDKTPLLNSVNHQFPQVIGVGDTVITVEFANANEPGSIRISKDSGVTWDEPLPLPESIDPRCVAISNSETSLLLLGTVDHGLFLSEDMGATWISPETAPEDKGIQCITLDPANPGHLFAATRVGVCESTDNGMNWSDITSRIVATPSFVVDIFAHPSKDGTFYTIVKNPAGTAFIKATRDGGKTWTDESHGIDPATQPRCFAFHPNDPEVVYMGTVYDGVFQFDNTLKVWSPINNGLPITKPIIIHCLQIIPGTPAQLFAGSNIDGQLYKREI